MSAQPGWHVILGGAWLKSQPEQCPFQNFPYFFKGFLSSFWYIKLDHDCFISNRFQFIIHSLNHLTAYHVSFWHWHYISYKINPLFSTAPSGEFCGQDHFIHNYFHFTVQNHNFSECSAGKSELFGNLWSSELFE